MLEILMKADFTKKWNGLLAKLLFYLNLIYMK
ncbi:unknown [Akkermansia sp. CAG:344]|nr:unknown [Akkermansia sp. CAG:344]